MAHNRSRPTEGRESSTPRATRASRAASRGSGFRSTACAPGKVFDLEVALDDPLEARRVATTAAEQALANDLIEGFEVVVP